MTTTTSSSRHSTVREGWLLLLIIGFACLMKTSAQATCSCAPSAYTWRFDFSATCPPPAIDEDANAGIDELTCTTIPGNATTDLTPTLVTFVQFLDINEDNTVAAQSEMTGEFVDGSTVSFTSITSLGNITGGIQLNINALNAQNETVQQTFLILFTNDCDVYPVFEADDSLGWMVFESFSEPRDELCPSSPQSPSSVPSSAPTGPPPTTPAPNPAPSVAPTTSPVVGTPAPTVPATPAPIVPATPAPTASSTPAPTGSSATPAPTAGSIPATPVPSGTPPSPSPPDMSMSMSMSMMSGGTVRFLEELFVASDWVEFGRAVAATEPRSKHQQQKKQPLMRLRR